MSVTANSNPCDVEPASPVDLGVLPEWLRSRLSKEIGWENYRDADCSSLWNFIRKLCDSIAWFDHCGTAVIDGQPVFVAEPYMRLEDDFSDARDFADRLDCNLVVDESSYWYPGKTIRLAFVPKK